MKKVWKVYDTLGKYALVVAVVVIFVCCTANVIARFVFDASLPWTSELSRYLLCYITFIGAFVLIREKAFIKMDMLEAKISPKVRPYYDVIMELLMISLAVVLVIYGKQLVMTGANQRSSVLHIPKDMLYTIIPVTGAFMIVNSLRNIVDTIGKILKKEEK